MTPHNFSAGKQWTLAHPKKKGKSGYKGSGQVVVESIVIKREYSFLEYIQVSGGEFVCDN